MLATTTLAPGCQRPIRPDEPTSEPVAAADIGILWDAALAVLRKHDLRPDRRDRANGVITTHPTTSQHFAEFWRQDVAGAYDFAHATLHTTRRQATVRFIHQGDEDWAISVQVDVSRLSAPETQITTASSVLQGFGAALPTVEGRVGDPAARRHWVPLGRDGAMEDWILDRILRSAANMS